MWPVGGVGGEGGHGHPGSGSTGPPLSQWVCGPRTELTPPSSTLGLDSRGWGQCYHLETLLEATCLVLSPVSSSRTEAVFGTQGDCIFVPSAWKLLKGRGWGPCLSGNPGRTSVSASPALVDTLIHAHTCVHTHELPLPCVHTHVHYCFGQSCP